MYKGLLELTHKFYLLGTSVVIGGLVVKDLIPLVMPQKVRKYYQFKTKDGEAVKISDHTAELLVQALQELSMPAEKVEKIDIFVVKKPLPQHYGSFSAPKHSLIGVPPNFECRSEQELREALKDGNLYRKIPWENPLSEKVKDVLLLTDDEKMFVLAQQLGYLDSRQAHGIMFMKLGFVCVHAAIFWVLNYFSNAETIVLKHGKRSLLHFNFAISACFTILLYLLSKDLLDNSMDTFADRYAAMINPAIAQAGVSYYTKQVEANKAIREIVPKLQKKLTSQGNEVGNLGLRYKITLSTKKSIVQKELDHHLQNNQEKDNDQLKSDSAV